jgi:hypothetical protein
MLVLDSTADDWENLEQIYRSVCLEFSAENYNPADAKSFYWRESSAQIQLSDVIDELRSLVEGGLMTVRNPDGSDLKDFRSDLSYLWRGWFKMTPEGRARLDEADAAGLYPDLRGDSDEPKTE